MSRAVDAIKNNEKIDKCLLGLKHFPLQYHTRLELTWSSEGNLILNFFKTHVSLCKKCCKIFAKILK